MAFTHRWLSGFDSGPALSGKPLFMNNFKTGERLV